MIGRLPALLLAVLLGAFGCGGNSDSTELTITARIGGHVPRFTLECDPAGGTAPRAQVLCAALEHNSKALLEPRPSEPEIVNGVQQVVHSCLSTSATVEVEGTYGGRAVAAHFEECTPGEQPGLHAWARLLGLAPRGPDKAVEALWRAARHGANGSVESISRFDVSIYQPVRRFHVKYETGRCEIWIATQTNGRLGPVRKLRDEKPCYATAPWGKRR